jgi:polysaccharide export outer membrane protein
MTILTLPRAIVVALALALAVTGVQAQAPAPVDKPAPVTSAVPGIDPSTYKVGPEDVLDISVWKEEGLKKEVLVRPDGGLSYPLIGEVQAAGKSVLELRDEIAKRLEKFIPDPAVSVAILKIGSQRIYVVGKVQKPGEFPVGRYVDVLQALSMAGGLTPFADANAIRVMRREGTNQVALPFEYNRVVRGDKVEQNIQLRAGDVVVVP